MLGSSDMVDGVRWERGKARVGRLSREGAARLWQLQAQAADFSSCGSRPGCEMRVVLFVRELEGLSGDVVVVVGV